MEPIIEPIPVNLIEQELTSERLLRRSNKADNLIYVVDAHNSPNTMREIGRLREISFRSSGGGTGKSCDIDEFDTMPNPCKQLLVWNPDKHEIIGAYRFIGGWDVDVRDGLPQIAMGHMFRFSDRFLNDILPVTIELGRSFVRPEYQSTREGVRALFALDNLWDGLGALTIVYPKVKYMFGKMTMYPSYDRECRDMLLCFLNLYFKDKENLVVPIDPLPDTRNDDPELTSRFVGNDFREDYKRLNTFIRQHGINIPPLVNAYMGLSPKMHMLGTAINREFGDVEETGILINLDEIADEKKRRHIDTYLQHLTQVLKNDPSKP